MRETDLKVGGEREREREIVNEQAELTGVHQYTLVLTKALECHAIYVSRVLLFLQLIKGIYAC